MAVSTGRRPALETSTNIISYPANATAATEIVAKGTAETETETGTDAGDGGRDSCAVGMLHPVDNASLDTADLDIEGIM
ncbi:MAG: hypothetical protein LQ347_004518 [Umbilicaria vellea]|nr:MAG: hypothetical protein LQ347_004518 [Umbilicaria vellea]